MGPSSVFRCVLDSFVRRLFSYTSTWQRSVPSDILEHLHPSVPMSNGPMRNHLILPSVILVLGMIVSTAIIANAVVEFKSLDQTVFVTGSARKQITSDMSLWTVNISHDAPKLAEAYALVSKDTPAVVDYLLKKGITSDQITRSSISTTTLREQKQGYSSDSGGTIVGYRVLQSIEVRSKDVRKIEVIAREATELLLKQGIVVGAQSPEFYCTSIGDLKQTMLADAAKDAQIRAQKIAESTGSKIGPLRSAKMGALQITPPGSTQVSDSGISDTTSIEKDITAVVNVSFALQ